jgi:hypothetical protein
MAGRKTKALKLSPPTHTETNADKPQSNKKPHPKGRKRPIDQLLLGDMEKMIRDAFKSYQSQGGGEMFDDELMKDEKFRQVFIKELFALSKKYFDILAARMRIEADREDGARAGANGGRVTNVFVIKGLYEDGAKVVDVTETVQEITDGPKRFQVKGLEGEG